MSFSNTFDTTNQGSAVSNREELSDVLTILAPEETPVLSSASKQKSSATFTEWTVDSLSAPSTAGVTEGADVTAFTDKFAGRARLGNYVQKFRRDFMVSDLQDAVESVGPAKIAQAEAKAIRELKRDVEATLIGTQDRSIEDGAGTAYGLRGLGDWIDSAGPSDVPADFRTPGSSIYDISTSGAFAESDLNDLISSIYRETGNSNNLMLVADTGLRRTIADFARVSAGATENIRSVNYDGNKAEIKLSVELYQSDHGMVSIVNMNPDTAPATLD
jgi:SpoU rRNA methylase family enzyme